MKNYSLLRSYIILIIIVKFCFLLLVLHLLVVKRRLKKNPDNIKFKASLEMINRRKYRVEFIFTILMACLLIYLFYPNRKEHLLIDYETRLLLYLFGFILIITADWGSFIHF